MKYRHFGDFVEKLGEFDGRLATTVRPFLKIERLSYGQLQKRVYQTAHYLASLDIGKGDRVMVIASNSPRWVELLLGTQLLGAILVPVDVGSSPETALRFAEQTKPKLVFKNMRAHSELDGQFRAMALDDLDEQTAVHPQSAPKIKLKGSLTALIIFTSGTTADPKGVMLSQANILSNVEAVERALDIDPDWRALSVLPLSHMYELTGGCLTLLSGGASIFYLPRVTPLAIGRGLYDYRITTVLAIPQLLTLLLERIRQSANAVGKGKTLAKSMIIAKGLPLPIRRLLFRNIHKHLGGSLKIVVTGGAPIPIEIEDAWECLGVKTLQGYGLTETSPILTVNRFDERRFESQGLTLDNVRLRIGENNEVQAKGPSIFGGYYQNDKATREAFTSDGWFKTGDVGQLENGWLKIQGRLKFAIVLSSGLKVFPEDIEQVATKQPILKDTCIVGVKSSSGEEVQAIVVSSHPDSVIDKAIAGVNAKLPSFQHIASWRRWPDSKFPRTRLQKIDRRTVLEWANRPLSAKHADVLSHGTSSDELIGIIRLGLGRSAASIHETDRLSDIGLDSLRRLNVLSLIEEQLGVAVAETSVTPTTTVAELRHLIAKGSPVEAPVSRPSWPYWGWVRFVGNGLRTVIIWPLLRIWVKQHTEGQEYLKQINTPSLFIFNHVDNLDGPVVYRALPPNIRKHLCAAAADDMLQKHKALAFVTRLCFAGFNLSRTEPYMPSLEYACQRIDQGWHVAISPEGKISKDFKLQPFKSGIGLLAVELGVPVVPVKTIGLAGTVPLHAKWPKRRSNVTVRIGRPIVFDKKDDYDEVARRLRQIIQDL